MYLIICLGNIGEKYKYTRHNVAWIIIDEIFKDKEWKYEKYANAKIFEENINDKKIFFVKPETFMNDSGNVIPFFQKNFSIQVENILVIQDEIDLPFGEIKISKDRGDAGHNGVKSIMNILGSKDFTRIRIGVSIKGEDGIYHKPDVLGNFNAQEIETLKKEVAPKVENIFQEFVLKS